MDRPATIDSVFMGDPLTGLASAVSFRARAIDLLRVGDVKIGTVKLIGFADYNGRRGYLEGDRLLQAMAESLLHRLDNATTLCARDGGRFLVMMPPDEPEPDLSVIGDADVDVRWHRIGSPEELDALLPPGPVRELPQGREGHDYIV